MTRRQTEEVLRAIFGTQQCPILKLAREAERRGVCLDVLVRQFIEEGLRRAGEERESGSSRERQREPKKPFPFDVIEEGIEKFKREQSIT